MTTKTANDPPNISEYDFDQMVAETIHRIDVECVTQCVETFARKYGWPIPVDKRPVVATVVAILVKDEENRRRT